MAIDSIKDRTIHGIGWSAVDNISYYAVTFFVGVILARLLSPDDFGLLGLTIIVTDICNAVINGGYTSALIRKRNPTDSDYNTAFVVNFVTSILLYLFIFFISPYISLFFNRYELTTILRVTSLGLIIGSIALVQRTQLSKVVDFKSQAKITVVSAFLSGIVGIYLAIIGYGVWALVVMGLVKTSSQSIVLCMVNKWKPQLSFSYGSFRELFGYGWKIMFTNILDVIWLELNQIVIGRFYNSSTLGQFSRAKQFSYLFGGNLTSIIQRVTFPVLSSIQDDEKKMVDAYRRIIKITMLLTAPGMLFIGAISQPLLYCLIGPKWHDAATYLPLMCIAGSTYPLQAVNLNMLQVKGRSDLYMKLGIIQKFLGLVTIIVGIYIGVLEMLSTSIFIWVIMFFFNSYYSKRIVGYGTLEQIKDVAPSYCLAFFISFAVHFFMYLPISYWIVLAIQFIVGIFLFLAICELSKKEEYMELKSIFLNITKKKFGMVNPPEK